MARASELGGPCDPVRVGLGNHYSPVVRDFFFKGGNVGGAVADGQADLEVFPIDE